MFILPKHNLIANLSLLPSHYQTPDIKLKEDRLILLSMEDKAQGSVLNGPDSFILTTSMSY